MRKDRAGRYVRQPAGYRAFIPSPLPPKPSLRLEGRLLVLLSEADQALARLDESTSMIANCDFFALMCIRKEGVLSSQIEGTQSSLQDVLRAEISSKLSGLPRDVGEVRNCIEAIEYGLKRLTDLPICVRLIREVHSKLLQGQADQHKLPGELRSSQNWIGPAGCVLSEAFYVPPPAQEVVVALGALEKFIHQPGQLPKLIWIALVHAQFEIIHPFLDGNGRVGRLLITLLLCQQKILINPVLYLSHYFMVHRQTYYDRLQAITNRGMWEEWLEFFLSGIIKVSKEVLVTSKKITELRTAHKKVIDERLGLAAHNSTKVLEKLFLQPVIQVKDLTKFINVSYRTANTITERLVACGILQKITSRSRNRIFAYQSYIDLFLDN